MKVIDGECLLDYNPTHGDDYYELECGCRFQVSREWDGLPDIPATILNRKNYNQKCPLVWSLFREGRTTGVFQEESPLGKRYSKLLRPEAPIHLAGLGAVQRPGVLKAKNEHGVSMADVYCNRKNGLEPIVYDIPELEEYLSETFGCMIYQEQILKIARKLAGFDALQAQVLLKTIAKKKQDALNAIGESFIEGCVGTGIIDRDKATFLWENIKKSGRYLFNRCIAGFEQVRRPSSEKHDDLLDIEEMYKIMNDREYAEANGRRRLHLKMQREGYGYGLSLQDDGRIRRNKILDVQEAGVREVFEIALSNGSRTYATGNHRFPTSIGELTVDRLIDMEGDWDDFDLFVCGTENQGKRGRGRDRDGHPSLTAKIVFIESVGEHQTYDVVMETPYHNFVTEEGVVTCNSHSVGYALHTFETAYLKTHFPAVFFMNYLDGANDKGDTTKEIQQLVRDLRRYGLRVTPPNFLNLDSNFSTDGMRIQFGLTNIKGIGDKAVDKIKGKLEGRDILNWDWYKFLTVASPLCGGSHLKTIIQAGGLHDYDLPRMRMVAEIDAWNGLTEKEQGGVLRLGEPVLETVPIYKTSVVGEEEYEDPIYDKREMAAYNKEMKNYSLFLESLEFEDDDEGPEDFEDLSLSTALAVPEGSTSFIENPRKPEHPAPIGVKKKKRKIKKTVQIDEYVLEIDPPRPVETLEDALVQILQRPGGIGKIRRDKVQSILYLLQNPPYPLVDESYMIEKQEEELLGVSITANVLDDVDLSTTDTSIQEYLDGKDDYEMTIPCKVDSYNIREVKNGDNKGRKMANLILRDGDSILEDVLAFPDAWELRANILMRPGAPVAVQGTRSKRDGTTFFINDAWSLS